MAKFRVLLVDDNREFIDLMKGYLSAQERTLEVDVASDNEAGYNVAALFDSGDLVSRRSECR